MRWKLWARTQRGGGGEVREGLVGSSPGSHPLQPLDYQQVFPFSSPASRQSECEGGGREIPTSSVPFLTETSPASSLRRSDVGQPHAAKQVDLASPDSADVIAVVKRPTNTFGYRHCADLARAADAADAAVYHISVPVARSVLRWQRRRRMRLAGPAGRCPAAQQCESAGRPESLS